MGPDQRHRGLAARQGHRVRGRTRYKLDDFQPLLYKTTDYGRTWTAIVNGIPATAFTRVVREDPGRRGLLYAGTETGLYVSFDDGALWRRSSATFPPRPSPTSW